MSSAKENRTSVCFLICTHKAPKIMETTLWSLARQRAQDSAELLIVNNGFSKEREAELAAFLTKEGWRLPVRFVPESTPGLGFARATGFRVSNAAWFSLLDDDNSIEPDFLENLLDLIGRYPNGGGISPMVAPIWENAPKRELEAICAQCLSYNSPSFPTEAVEEEFAAESFDFVERPPGGGMIIRDSVAKRYCEVDPRRHSLGRTGSNLMGCEDHDIWAGIKSQQLSIVRSNRLRMYHHIPASRTELGYLTRLNYSMAKSYAILRGLSSDKTAPPSLARRALHLARLAKIAFVSRESAGWRMQLIEASRSLGTWAGQRARI